MSYGPRVAYRTARSPMRPPPLRVGPRVLLEEGFTNGTNGWEATGDGAVAIVDDSLEVTLGAGDTTLTAECVDARDGQGYVVEVDAEANPGTIAVHVDGAEVIAPTGDTGLISGEFVATTPDPVVEVIVDGAQDSVVEINLITVKLGLF